MCFIGSCFLIMSSLICVIFIFITFNRNDQRTDSFSRFQSVSVSWFFFAEQFSFITYSIAIFCFKSSNIIKNYSFIIAAFSSDKVLEQLKFYSTFILGQLKFYSSFLGQLKFYSYTERRRVMFVFEQLESFFSRKFKLSIRCKSDFH